MRKAFRASENPQLYWDKTIQVGENGEVIGENGEMFFVDGESFQHEVDNDIREILTRVYGEEFQDEIEAAIGNYNYHNADLNDSILYGGAEEEQKRDILLSRYNHITLDCCTVEYYELSGTVIIKEFNKRGECARGRASEKLLEYLNTYYPLHRVIAQAATDEVGKKVYENMLHFIKVGDKRLYVKYP